MVQPDSKGLKQDFSLFVGKIGETLHHGACEVDHHIGCTDRGGGQDRAVEHRHRQARVSPAAQRHPGLMKRPRGVAQIAEAGADTHPADGHPATKASTAAGYRSVLTCTIPTCTSGSFRHAEETSKLRSLAAISGNASAPDPAASAAITTNGPVVGSRR